MAGAFMTPEELQRILDQQSGGPPRSAGAFAMPGMAPEPAPDPFAGQIPQMAFGGEDPTMTTGDMGLDPGPQRMMAGSWDIITRKRMAGVPLTPEEEAQVAAGERYKTEIGEPAARDIFGEVSGVNAMGRGGSNFVAGAQSGSPLQMAAGVGEAALGALPGASLVRPLAPAVRALTGTMPRAGAFMGGATLPGAIMASQEASAARTAEQVQDELRRMRPEELAAYQRSIGVTPDGKLGPATITAAIEADKRRDADAAQRAQAEAQLQAQSMAGDNEAKIAAAKIKAEGDAAIARERARAEREAEEKKTAAVTPFRDLYPHLTPFFPAVSVIGGGLLGGAIKGLYGRSFNKGVDGLEKRLSEAITAKNKPLAKGLQSQLTERITAGPGGTAPAIAAAAGFGAEASLLPDEIDFYRGVRDKDKGMLQHLGEVTGRGAIGSAIGALPALTTSKIMQAIQKRPALNMGPEIDAITARGRGGSGGGGGAKKPAVAPPAPGASVDDIAAAASQRRRRAGSETAAQPAQSPPRSTAGQPAAPATAPQSPPSDVSPRSPSLSLSAYKRVVRRGDDTAAVSPRQFVPGQRGEPASGLHKSLIKNDESVLELARNMAGGGQKLTAASFQSAAKERLGLDMSPGQANRVLRDIKGDEVVQKLKADVDRAKKAERARTQRANKAAALKEVEKTNQKLLAPPKKPEIE
jgi:hypothetical protein